MNLVGKIFTVLICVMSIFFCALAVAVYATHKNWKLVVDNPREKASHEHPLGLSYALEDEKAKNQQLEDEKIQLETRLTAEKNAAVQALAKLESEHQTLNDEYDRTVQERDSLRLSQSDAVAAMNSAHEALAKKRDEIQKLRQDIDQAQKDRDAYFKDVVRLTDDLHHLEAEEERLKDRQLDLAEELADAKEVLQKFGLKPVPELYREKPPPLDGLVTRVIDNRYLVISLGADEGLLKGHELQVTRGTSGTYVGKIKIVKTDVDNSVCSVEYQQSPVQVNDFVTTRIQY